MDLELTFTGEELELVMDALRAAVPIDDPMGEKIMLRDQESEKHKRQTKRTRSVSLRYLTKFS